MVALPWESSPRSVPASLAPASPGSVVWFESPALASPRPLAPPASGPEVGRAPALAAPSAPRSRAAPAKPADPPAERTAVPERALPASEEQPALAESPPEAVPTEAAGSQNTVAQTLIGAAAAAEAVAQSVAGAAAEPEGTGAASVQGLGSAPGGVGSHGAAVPGGGGTTASAGATELMDYARRLSRVVGRQRRYPASAARLGMEGTARVQVRVNRDGSLAGAPKLVRSSGHEVLDAEALRMVEAAAPFAPLPEGHSRPSAEFVIPVDFSLRTPG